MTDELTNRPAPAASQAPLVVRRDLRALKRTLLVALMAALPVAAPAQAQRASNGTARSYPIDPEAAPRPVLRALEITDAIRIDGRLDEPAWQRADSATDFITALPRDGYPASERTVARVLFDGATLYVGAYMYDAQPERLYSPGLEQDFDTQQCRSVRHRVRYLPRSAEQHHVRRESGRRTVRCAVLQ